MRDHDADAAGDPAVLAAKRELREEAWAALVAAEAARFPGVRGRIPNFVGAEAAAERLRQLPEWRAARTIKANPDAPQWPVRQRALEDGIAVLMAVPRLADERPFLLLEPSVLDVGHRAASSIKGSSVHGRPMRIEDLGPIDMVVSGCVAVDRRGARLGKGGGFADLEFALLTAAGLVSEKTLVVTTVHSSQLVESGRIPMTGHDVGVDVVVTPDETIRCDRQHHRPVGLDWAELSEEKILSIPVIHARREQHE